MILLDFYSPLILLQLIAEQNFELEPCSSRFLLAVSAYAQETSFVYNGFRAAKLSLNGIAGVTSNGLLKLTNDTMEQKGHAFHADPVRFKILPNVSFFSFSTMFIFAIHPQYATLSGHDIVFVVAPQRGLPGSLQNQYLGMFNKTDNNKNTNHVSGVELDTILNSEFHDINDNHVGINLNEFKNLTLISGKAMQVWVDYDGMEKQIHVTLAPINVTLQKPQTPLLSLSRDLSSIINESMYVGFSSLTGPFLTSHYVLGWSFRVNGEAPALALSQLPKLPQIGRKETLQKNKDFAMEFSDG